MYRMDTNDPSLTSLNLQRYMKHHGNKNIFGTKFQTKSIVVVYTKYCDNALAFLFCICNTKCNSRVWSVFLTGCDGMSDVNLDNIWRRPLYPHIHSNSCYKEGLTKHSACVYKM